LKIAISLSVGIVSCPIVTDRVDVPDAVEGFVIATASAVDNQ
jgi:hypothetical protein